MKEKVAAKSKEDMKIEIVSQYISSKKSPALAIEAISQGLETTNYL